MQRLSPGIKLIAVLLLVLITCSGCLDYESRAREIIIHEAVEDLTSWGEAPSPLLQKILDFIDKISGEEHGYVGVGCYSDKTCSQGRCDLETEACVPCGNAGEWVCLPPDPPCVSPSFEPQGGFCRRSINTTKCGSVGEPPCEYGCDFGNLGNSGICEACGGHMQPVCQGLSPFCDLGLKEVNGHCELPPG